MHPLRLLPLLVSQIADLRADVHAGREFQCAAAWAAVLFGRSVLLGAWVCERDRHVRREHGVYTADRAVGAGGPVPDCGAVLQGGRKVRGDGVSVS